MAGSTDPNTAGNGSLMRLAPVVLYFYPDAVAVDRYAAESSKTTHGAPEAVDACRIFARILCAALADGTKSEILRLPPIPVASNRLASIAAGAYRGIPADQIRGTGYVVDCLEAALWSFAETDCFRDAILTAANLGEDADTTAAVCGQIAGAYYGVQGIPGPWLERLAFREEIETLAIQLGRRSG